MRTSAIVLLLAFAAASVGATCKVEPAPMPPTSAGGSPGIGGDVGPFAGAPGTGGAAGEDGGTPECLSTCCQSCKVLRVHHCREGEPTANRATCEDRNCTRTLPGPMQLANLTACTTLECIRAPGKGKRGVTCEGGQ
jgi:hypothetical protein